MTMTLVEMVLVAGLDDWVPLRVIYGFAQQREQSADTQNRQTAVLEAIRFMVADQLVEIGEVSGGGFFSWDSSPPSSLSRVEKAYTLKDPDFWGFSAWLSNTSKGDAISRAVMAREEEQV